MAAHQASTFMKESRVLPKAEKNGVSCEDGLTKSRELPSTELKLLGGSVGFSRTSVMGVKWRNRIVAGSDGRLSTKDPQDKDKVSIVTDADIKLEILGGRFIVASSGSTRGFRGKIDAVKDKLNQDANCKAQDLIDVYKHLQENDAHRSTLAVFGFDTNGCQMLSTARNDAQVRYTHILSNNEEIEVFCMGSGIDFLLTKFLKIIQADVEMSDHNAVDIVSECLAHSCLCDDSSGGYTHLVSVVQGSPPELVEDRQHFITKVVDKFGSHAHVLDNSLLLVSRGITVDMLNEGHVRKAVKTKFVGVVEYMKIIFVDSKDKSKLFWFVKCGSPEAKSRVRDELREIEQFFSAGRNFIRGKILSYLFALPPICTLMEPTELSFREIALGIPRFVPQPELLKQVEWMFQD